MPVVQGNEQLVFTADLFDAPPTEAWTAKFLASDGHHLLVAVDDKGDSIGFVSGRGVAKALVAALADVARSRGCYGMWVATEPDNSAALATYRAAGAAPPESSVIFSWTFG